MHPIKQALKKNGMTQAELAERLDVSPAFVSAVIRKKRLPSDRLVARCEEILDCPFPDVETSGSVGRPLSSETLRQRALEQTALNLACAVLAQALSVYLGREINADHAVVEAWCEDSLKAADEALDAEDVELWVEDVVEKWGHILELDN